MPKVIFEGEGIEIDVPVGSTILEAAARAGAMVGSACGGVCACSTCHVHVQEGLADLSPADDREEDIMDKAFDVRPVSRLGCQAKLIADRVYRVAITRESRKAYLDEHPVLRAALEAARPGTGAAK
jgi:ferredoxin, 2Fe-2S